MTMEEQERCILDGTVEQEDSAGDDSDTRPDQQSGDRKEG